MTRDEPDGPDAVDALADQVRLHVELTHVAPSSNAGRLSTWSATLSAVTSAAATSAPRVEVGRLTGLTVDLHRASARDVMADLTSISADHEVMGLTLLGLRATARGLQGARMGAMIVHAQIDPDFGGLDLGPVLLRQGTALLALGRAAVPVVALPYPQGGEEMAPTVLAEAIDDVRATFAAAGFSPATAAAGGMHELSTRAAAPWWAIAQGPTRTHGAHDEPVPDHGAARRIAAVLDGTTTRTTQASETSSA